MTARQADETVRTNWLTTELEWEALVAIHRHYWPAKAERQVDRQEVEWPSHEDHESQELDQWAAVRMRKGTRAAERPATASAQEMGRQRCSENQPIGAQPKHSASRGSAKQFLLMNDCPVVKAGAAEIDR